VSIQQVKRFLELESAGGIVLFIAALLAMIWANSPLAYLHQQFIEKFLFIINDGLMALFFLIVGLELKRGYLSGQLSQLGQVILPFFAALGGMLLPALIYYWVNSADPITLKAWATPVATDIAFALGVLSLLGRRVPTALKLFLLALAIFDDIGAIIIISLFYSSELSWVYLLLAAALLALLFLFNHFNIRSLLPYLAVGALLWGCFLFSGVHPTIAGVLLAFTIPDGEQGSSAQDSLADARSADSATDSSTEIATAAIVNSAANSIANSMLASPLHRLENGLHFWVAFVIMPLFALANAGLSLHEMTWATLGAGVTLGIVLGLFLGKQMGVFLFSLILIKLKFAKLPGNCSWIQLYGVALVCGIGFTMSLFIGTLSFPHNDFYLAQMRLGVIFGSFLSGLFAAIVLLFGIRKKLG
jgi:NhaA family Na+:H+ antiporter